MPEMPMQFVKREAVGVTTNCNLRIPLLDYPNRRVLTDHGKPRC
jgi:hypothetical protein